MGVDYVADVVKKHPGLKRPSIHNPIRLPASLSSMKQIVADQIFNSNETSSAVDEELTLNERVEKELGSEIAQAAVLLGFDSILIRKLIRKKLERENVGYSSAESLVDDLQNNEEAQNIAEEAMESETTTSFKYRPQCPSSLTSSPMSSTSSSRSSSDQDIAADSISNDISAIPAGQLLMEPSSFHFSSNSFSPPPSAPLSPASSLVNSIPSCLDEDDDMIHDEDRCKVCLDKKSDCLFMPCNHLCCCTGCSMALKTCPVCRTKLKTILKVYRH